ncbi:MAG TPA: hypothetical protein VGK73_33355 [Polyangiaceae bacterium]
MADEKYLAWLRKQPCAMTGQAAPSHPHHSTCAPTYAPGEREPKQLPGRRGKSQKSADYYAFSLSIKAHRQFHDGTGPFAGWSNEERDAWQNEQSARYRAAYDRENEAAPTPGAARVVQRIGLVEARIEELEAHYQPGSGSFRMDLKRFARLVAEEARAGRY